MIRIATLILALALALAPPAAASGSLTLTGRGEVTRPPDMATITLGAEATRPTAGAAMDATSQSVAAILEVLTKAGVAPRDVQTTALTLSPARRQDDPDDPPAIVAFSAANALSVRVRDLGDLGRVLDAVADAGANSLRGLSFAMADPAEAEAEARRAAIADAMAKARLYADAAEVDLGPIAEIRESGVSRPEPMMLAEAAMARGGGAVPVAEGELTFAAEVIMVFDLAQ